VKILAVDYGDRRTGIAVSDDLGITAQGLDTIEVKDAADLPGRIAAAAKETGAGRIVFGLPLNMDGSESDRSRTVREAGAAVADLTGLPVIFWDERLTSIQADRISATLILQEFLKTLP